MTLQQLKDQIILKLGDMYNSIQFEQDIDECRDGWEIMCTLEEYGYDKQGALDIIFSIVID